MKNRGFVEQIRNNCRTTQFWEKILLSLSNGVVNGMSGSILVVGLRREFSGIRFCRIRVFGNE